MFKIATFLNDILEAKKRGKTSGGDGSTGWGSYYEKKFGSDWQKDDKDFWRNFPSW
jgi:hypothetical protein